jgi:hypothetical protein
MTSTNTSNYMTATASKSATSTTNTATSTSDSNEQAVVNTVVVPENPATAVIFTQSQAQSRTHSQPLAKIIDDTGHRNYAEAYIVFPAPPPMEFHRSPSSCSLSSKVTISTVETRTQEHQRPVKIPMTLRRSEEFSTQQHSQHGQARRTASSNHTLLSDWFVVG